MQDAYWIVAIVVNVFGALVTIGTMVWKLGVLHATVSGLRDWVKDIADGRSATCAGHAQKLADHERRITHLEDNQE